MDMSYVGARIKERRLALGLTQTNIKEAVNISSGTLSDIENGKKLPSSITLCALSIVLDCSIDWILTGEVRSCENQVNDYEKELLFNFRKLNSENQEEIMDIINLKISKMEERKKERLSDSGDSNPVSSIA